MVSGGRPSRERYSEQRFTVPDAEIFGNPSHVRCDIQCTQGANYRLPDCRLQPAPGTTYMARPYTDKSYTSHASLEAYFHPTRCAERASAAVIVKDSSEYWRHKPVFVMHTVHEYERGAKEYLALAAATVGAHTDSTRSWLRCQV